MIIKLKQPYFAKITKLELSNDKKIGYVEIINVEDFDKNIILDIKDIQKINEYL